MNIKKVQIILFVAFSLYMLIANIIGYTMVLEKGLKFALIEYASLTLGTTTIFIIHFVNVTKQKTKKKFKNYMIHSITLPLVTMGLLEWMYYSNHQYKFVIILIPIILLAILLSLTVVIDKKSSFYNKTNSL